MVEHSGILPVWMLPQAMLGTPRRQLASAFFSVSSSSGFGAFSLKVRVFLRQASCVGICIESIIFCCGGSADSIFSRQTATRLHRPVAYSSTHFGTSIFGGSTEGAGAGAGAGGGAAAGTRAESACSTELVVVFFSPLSQPMPMLAATSVTVRAWIVLRTMRRSLRQKKT